MNTHASLYLICTLPFLIAQSDGCDEPSTIDIAANHPDIRYDGRWSFENPAEPVVGWQGSSIDVNFYGTGMAAKIAAGSNLDYFRVIIDGDHQNSQKIAVGRAMESVPLVSGLQDGLHRLTLVKETYQSGESRFAGFELTGSALAPAPAAKTRRIEFYGDSNLAGYSLESEENQGGLALRGSHFTYAGITARQFDAGYQNISVSGATISSIHQVFDDYSRQNSQNWPFEDHPADVVVVNLGANDVGRNEALIKADYHAFLDDLRGVHPDAHILLFNGRGWSFDEPGNYTDEVVAERGDPKMRAALFPWYFEQWHGCESDHGGMAMVLADLIEEMTGWEAQEPDIFSGFGENGDVANGSFESAAPFGGYGWRYLSDGNITRVEDPAQAKDGRFYMHVDAGGQLHQPNGVNPGQEIVVTLWARGSTEHSEAEITLDFRDQEMWSSPLFSETTILELSEEWQSFTVSARAPTDGGRPVFHTRLTLDAQDGQEFDVDDISMVTR